jgi:hypothetical protein
MSIFAVVNIVWGEEYTKVFTDISLPTFLAPGNLEFLAKQAPCIYRLYTTPQDELAMQNSESFKKLKNLMPVQVKYFDINSAANGDPLVVVSQQYNLAVQEFNKESAMFIPMCPDIVISDGSLAYVYSLIASGKKAVLISSERISKEKNLEYLRNKPILTGRELSNLIINCQHKGMAGQLWSDQNASAWPSHISWKIGNYGMLVRPFHVHPFAVQLSNTSLGSTGTIDSDLVVRAGASDAVLIKDSDQACMAEISSDEIHLGPFGRCGEGNPIQAVVDWAKCNTNTIHKAHVREIVRFHTGEIDASWQSIEVKSNKVVGDILCALSAGGNF